MNLTAFLKSESPLFRGFPEEKLEALVAGGCLLEVAPGEFLARCGDDPRFLGVVIDGELLATAPGEGSRPEPLICFNRVTRCWPSWKISTRSRPCTTP